MSKFNFIKTDIPDVQIIEPTVFGDDRGYFMETYQIDEFAAAGIDKPFVQDNQSRSTKGVLRGLHFQTKHTQGKLVRVTLGEVFDVAEKFQNKSRYSNSDDEWHPGDAIAVELFKYGREFVVLLIKLVNS
jgi:dTDP-4-dehydrorhamnose 3,5-epimerase